MESARAPGPVTTVLYPIAMPELSVPLPARISWAGRSWAYAAQSAASAQNRGQANGPPRPFGLSEAFPALGLLLISRSDDPRPQLCHGSQRLWLPNKPVAI